MVQTRVIPTQCFRSNGYRSLDIGIYHFQVGLIGLHTRCSQEGMTQDAEKYIPFNIRHVYMESQFLFFFSTCYQDLSLYLLILNSGSMLDYRKFISCERWSRGKHVKFKNRILIAGPVCKVDCHGMLYICSNSRLKRYTNPSPEVHRGSPVPR